MKLRKNGSYSGPKGCGKTLVLSHVLHFFHTSPDFVVVNFGNLYKWLYKNFDVEKSSRDPKLFDHVVDSQMLLTHFKDFNAGKLEGLSTHQTYVWSPRSAGGGGWTWEDSAY